MENLNQQIEVGKMYKIINAFVIGRTTYKEAVATIVGRSIFPFCDKNYAIARDCAHIEKYFLGRSAKVICPNEYFLVLDKKDDTYIQVLHKEEVLWFYKSDAIEFAILI